MAIAQAQESLTEEAKRLFEEEVKVEERKPKMLELEKLEKRRECPECGSSKLVRDYQQAELKCGNCGFIITEKIMDMGPEWRAFDQEQKEKRGRVGAPITYAIHDKGLSTMIDWRDRDSHGIDLTPKKRAEIYRLRKWQKRVRVQGVNERNLAFALTELDRMASNLGLSRNVRESAAVIYRRASKERLIRGRSIEGVAATALYAACRECKVPRTLKEIAEVSRVSKKEVGRDYRLIVRELLTHSKPTSPIDYVPRFVSELGLSGEVQSKAIELLKEAAKKGLTSGRGPTGVAAAAIYIADKLYSKDKYMTQREIADVARVTEVTVRNRYKELSEKLGLNIWPF